MTGPLDQSRASSQGEQQPDQPAPQTPTPAAKAEANGQAKAQPNQKPQPPVGSDAPNRWLTTDPPDDIDALRSSSSLGHRTGSSRRRRSRFRIGLVPMVVTIALLAGLAVWQLGLLDSLFSPTPDVQAALNNAGFGTVTATVNGETVTLTGSAESEIIVNQVSAVALSVDGIRQVDNQVTVPTTDEVVTLEDQIQAALLAAGFGDLTVLVNGDMATVSGTVANEESLSVAALAVLAVPGVAQLDNRLEIGTLTGSADLISALAAALAADEFAYTSFEIQSGLAVLMGAVPTEEARTQAVAAVMAIDGIDKLDNRLTVDADLPIGPALPPEQLEAAAATALSGAGIVTVKATVDGRRAVLDGTVPLETLGSGFFAFVDMAETAVLSVDGIDQVSSRLKLRGDGGILRSELQSLLAATPVEFALGSSDLSEEGQVVLDQVALIIQSQPGLQVIIAGHTDAAGSSETNEALARQRAGAVLNYLLTRGVPSYRLVALSYGELFPDQEASAEQNRRIEFEVGP
jgi:outer membrane protein OmpA-like peptidoglycan-associated protein